jgi:hypothetical protein
VNKFILQKQNQIVDELLFDFLSHISWKLDEEKFEFVLIFWNWFKISQFWLLFIWVSLTECCVCACVFLPNFFSLFKFKNQNTSNEYWKRDPFFKYLIPKFNRSSTLPTNSSEKMAVSMKLINNEKENPL